MTKIVKEGNNPYNNRVYVDFEKKTIKFVPIGKKSVRKYYWIFFSNLAMFYFMFSIVPCIVMFSFISDLYYPNYLITVLTWIGSTFLMAKISARSFYNLEWRKREYPRLNAKIHKWITFGKKIKKKIVEPNSIVNNMFFIPHFNNLFIKYKVFGDFSKQLKAIRIINIFKADPFNWNCVFEFKKKPVDGYLEVEYA